MMITTKKLLPLFWAALIMLALAACGGASPVPAAEPSVETETPKSIQTEFESGGLRLRVPEEYAGLVTVATGEDPLFSVSEIASQEAAKSRDPDNWEGAGWLFSISRITWLNLPPTCDWSVPGRSRRRIRTNGRPSPSGQAGL